MKRDAETVCPYRKGWYCTVTGKMLGPLACGSCRYFDGRRMTVAGTVAVAEKNGILKKKEGRK